MLIQLFWVVVFATLGIYQIFKIQQAKKAKDLFEMLDAMFSCLLVFLAIIMTGLRS